MIAAQLFDALQNRKQDAGQINGAGHGNAGKKGAHHDQFRGKIFAVVEFYGIENGIHRRRNGSHDEDGLAHHRREGDSHEFPDINQKKCHHRRHHQADEASQPGVHIAEGDFAPVNLHAQGNHDDGHQGGGAVLENGPEEGGCHIKAGILDGKNHRQRINDGHMEHHGQGVPGCELSFACLVKAQCVEAHVHLHQHHGGRRTGHSQIGSLSIHHVGGVGKDKGNQGDADISIIGKHGTVLKGFCLGNRKAPNLSHHRADDPQNHHERKGEEKHVEHGHIDFSHINAVENEAGQHHVKGELSQGCHVHVVAPVHEVADGHENEEGQDIV